MTAQAKTLTQDEAQIRSNIQSFSALADQDAYEYLGRLFAPEVLVDYTSLFGGEAETVDRVELMKRWAGFLPGFDTTYHDLSNLNVDIDGDNATATVDFTASHWLGADGFWAVSGRYDFTLSKLDGQWAIKSVKVHGKGEEGSRDVLGKVGAFAKDNLEVRNARAISLN